MLPQLLSMMRKRVTSVEECDGLRWSAVVKLVLRCRERAGRAFDWRPPVTSEIASVVAVNSRRRSGETSEIASIVAVSCSRCSGETSEIASVVADGCRRCSWETSEIATAVAEGCRGCLRETPEIASAAAEGCRRCLWDTSEIASVVAVHLNRRECAARGILVLWSSWSLVLLVLLADSDSL